MQPRVNMIMAAAQDVPALRRFYEHVLRWTAWGPASDMSVLYKVGTSILVFPNADYQAQESGLPKADGVKSIRAICVDSKDAVDRDMGLYSGYFADPQGNGWEVVWSPYMPIGANGGLTLPGQ